MARGVSGFPQVQCEGLTSGVLQYARHLKKFWRRRRYDMTDAEQRSWYRLRRKQIGGVQFYRQKPIGPYIVDFYALKSNLVIELDGSQHTTAAGLAGEAMRNTCLNRLGLKVMRLDKRRVLLETDAVLEVIWREVIARR